MHTVIVKLKNGREVRGSLKLFRPIGDKEGEGNDRDGFLTLFGSDVRFYFKNIESAITDDLRGASTNDELKRARKYLKDARRYGWGGIDSNYPIQEWENGVGGVN